MEAGQGRGRATAGQVRAFVCRVKKSCGKKMPCSYAMDVERLALSETYVSPKGVKSVQLTVDGGGVYWLVEALPVVFEPRSYDGNEQTRVSLCLLTTQAVDAQISNLDDAVVALATQNSVALFGKQLSE